MSDPPVDPVEQAFQAAMALHTSGRIEDARAAYRAIVEAHPDHARALHSLGVLEKNAGAAAVGVELISRAIAILPAAEFYNNLGDALQLLMRNEEAMGAFERAIAIAPDYVKAYNNLAMVQSRVGRAGEAVETMVRAVALRPDYARGIASLGSALVVCGRQAEALACFRRAIELEPGYQIAHSNLLMASHYLEHDPGALARMHREWGERFADLVERDPRATPSASPRGVAREGKIRVGYVSPDFYGHAVSNFFMPVLEHHDRSKFHVTCFSNVPGGDAVTQKLRERADEWHEIVGLSDEAAAQLVRDQGIDILVDLAGHSARNRLMMFARKAAPVQVTWLGYPNTTGMVAIGFRVTDAHADPLGETESLHTERLVRLSSCWCYGPPGDAPEVAPPPSSLGAAVTFGSFNTLAKVTPGMIETWAKVLHAAAGSRMVIKALGGGDESVRRRLVDQFAKYGIGAERVEIRGRDADFRKHLESYGEVDVMLDTFPYHGTTMTCEAMWMGVPVVTLAGAAHVSRVGVSLLTSAGLAEFVASSREEYVAIASALGADVARLKALRATMRSRMAPLVDAARFTRELESAFESMLETKRQ